jgi:hypothetical protein
LAQRKRRHNSERRSECKARGARQRHGWRTRPLLGLVHVGSVSGSKKRRRRDFHRSPCLSPNIGVQRGLRDCSILPVTFEPQSSNDHQADHSQDCPNKKSLRCIATSQTGWTNPNAVRVGPSPKRSRRTNLFIDGREQGLLADRNFSSAQIAFHGNGQDGQRVLWSSRHLSKRHGGKSHCLRSCDSPRRLSACYCQLAKGDARILGSPA